MAQTTPEVLHTGAKQADAPTEALPSEPQGTEVAQTTPEVLHTVAKQAEVPPTGAQGAEVEQTTWRKVGRVYIETIVSILRDSKPIGWWPFSSASSQASGSHAHETAVTTQEQTPKRRV